MLLIKSCFTPVPCLVLPCLGAGQLRNTRLDSFLPNGEYILVLDSQLNSSTINSLNSGENCPIWFSSTYLKLSEWSCPAPRHGRTKHGSVFHIWISWTAAAVAVATAVTLFMFFRNMLTQNFAKNIRTKSHTIAHNWHRLIGDFNLTSCWSFGTVKVCVHNTDKFLLNFRKFTEIC